MELHPNNVAGAKWRGSNYNRPIGFHSKALLEDTHALSLLTALPIDMNQYIWPLEQIYILTINIPGDYTIFLKFPIYFSELIKTILHLQQATIYFKNSFYLRIPWIH